MCGEKRKGDYMAVLCMGSPPRVRGKALWRGLRVATRRITPACAGKSKLRNRTQHIRRDHPRVCGEKLQAEQAATIQQGSPPRVRGKVIGIHPLVFLTGITPACAGKSGCLYRYRFRAWDHPRVCGEKPYCWGSKIMELGSPPRVRGKETKLESEENEMGITPACAGKRLKKALKNKDF